MTPDGKIFHELWQSAERELATEWGPMSRFTTGELFNELLRRIDFDGMDPRTFSLAELQRAIKGAEWPRDPGQAAPDPSR